MAVWPCATIPTSKLKTKKIKKAQLLHDTVWALKKKKRKEKREGNGMRNEWTRSPNSLKAERVRDQTIRKSISKLRNNGGNVSVQREHAVGAAEGEVSDLIASL